MNLSDLKKICEAATPGPWTEEDQPGTPFRRVVGGEDVILLDDVVYQDDSRFISTFNPELVGKLLAVVEAAEALEVRYEDNKFVIDGGRYEVSGGSLGALRASLSLVRDTVEFKVP